MKNKRFYNYIIMAISVIGAFTAFLSAFFIQKTDPNHLALVALGFALISLVLSAYGNLDSLDSEKRLSEMQDVLKRIESLAETTNSKIKSIETNNIQPFHTVEDTKSTKRVYSLFTINLHSNKDTE